MKKKRFVRRKIAGLLAGLLTVTVIAGAAAYEQSYISEASNSYTYDAEFEKYLTEQGFPESYKVLLRQLHEEHPNWVFQAFHTGLEWSDVIENEMYFRRNLVPDLKQYPSSYKDTTLNGSFNWKNNAWVILSAPYWVQASEEAVEYYIDPRNFLTEQYMFQFELLTFNEEAQTLEGVEQILNGTFMSNTYVDGGTGEAAEEEILTSDTLAVRSTYICGILPQMTVEDFIGELMVSEGTIQVADASGNLKSLDAYIATGDCVEVYLQEETSTEETTNEDITDEETANKQVLAASYTVVLFGDVNGDGLIDDVDRLYLKRHVYGVSSLKDWYFFAADLNSDGTVDDIDRLYIKRHVYGVSSISQLIGSDEGEKLTYAEAFYKIGKELNVSPYMLAARVRQEQGSGTSELISGTVPGYEGYYNYFNIKASGTTREEIVRNGMEEAVANGWDTRYKALAGGAATLCEGHIWKGQDTLYLQKFDVEGEYYGYYWHQYMQNLLAACSEGSNVYKAYVNMDALDNSFVFKIPVYLNMPDSCPKPVKDGNPNYRLGSLTVAGYDIAFRDSIYEYTIDVPKSVTSLQVSAAAYASTTKVEGTGNIKLSVSTERIVVKTIAQNGDTKEYIIKLNRN